MSDNTNNMASNLSAYEVSDLSFETTKIISLIYAGVALAIEMFGIVTNIMNIACFVKQGFKEPINVSLLGLAISDMCSLITLIFANISFTLMFNAVDVPFDVMGVSYLIASHPHLTFTRVTSWITALITLERCLSISIPLKVKNIVTPKRVCIIIIFVYVIILSSEAPVYVVNKLEMIFVPERNKTIFTMISTDDKEHVEKIAISINNFATPFAAFLVTIICTIILVISLLKNSKWQKTSMKGTDVSLRNQRVAKMIVMISTLFISCFIPISIYMLIFLFVPEFAIGGKYMNISIVACCIVGLLEAINSSANIFIYYFMSSNFRYTFREVFYKSIVNKH